MRKKIAAILAGVGVMITMFIAAPPAFAIREVHASNDCNYIGSGGSHIYVSIDVTWYASDDHRYILESTSMTLASGVHVDAVSLGAWVTAIGGNWVNYGFVSAPIADVPYYWIRTPGQNPGQGHYWLARGRDEKNNACDVQVLN